MLKTTIIQLILICGIVYAAPTFDEVRIVNGTDADISDFPFVVSLRWLDSHFCGATLISSFWVLSAALCVDGYLYPAYYSVQYSSTDIISESEISLYISGISDIIMHEGYDNWERINDIAVLRTIREIDLTLYAPLPPPFMGTLPGVTSTLVGWGYNATFGNVHTTLQRVDLDVYSNSECASRHEFPVFPSNICAGVEGGGKGPCNLDYGGPLIVSGIEVGIASWSIRPCGIAPYPSVYTRVSYYREWIRQRTGV